MTRVRVPQSRIILSNEERERLLELGDGVGSDVLKLVSIVHLRTYQRWLERKSQGQQRRDAQPNRPRIRDQD
ncbi:hypothetical protein [Posidoniimonas corsicana]|uniref:hypothetical protein n=1 Tax=Posidoniimonas corsicana TaxID=1938618 RepID=UPI0018D3A998|nr:hypothetical protein [Posidoniimonas corsicana]